MALNPSTQDKRGIVLGNSDGSFDSKFPAGSDNNTGGSTTYTITHHVATTGSDTTGNGSESNPWRTPEYAAKQLTAGDVLGIHAGTYILNQNNLPAGQQAMDRTRALVSPANGVAGTAGNEVVITSAGDGVVFLDAGTSPQWAALGSYWGSDYLIINDILVRGCIIMWGVSNMLVERCEVYGGGETPKSNGGDDFGNVLRIEYCTDSTVRNNLLRDNADFGEGQANSPLIMEYDSANVVIEHNELYGSIGHGIRIKDNPVDIVIRNNYIHDNQFSGIQGANQDTGHDITIHNNIIRNNNLSNTNEYGGLSQLTALDGWQVYNNTFINNNVADVRTVGAITDNNFWNNIFYNSSGIYYYNGFSSSGASFAGNWTYSDFNCFYTGGEWIDQSTTYSTLTSYSQATGFDTNSVETNPNFINVSGTAAADFKRSSYPLDGRGGAYESVMGAYIDGSEVIGIEP